MRTGSTTLACQHVGKLWSGLNGTSVAALRDIEMTVESGEFVAILGPSGCGKSTLLELIAGLEPLSSGRIIEEVRIDLPRPRRMTDPGFNDYRARLTETLEREVMRAHSEDEGLASNAA